MGLCETCKSSPDQDPDPIDEDPVDRGPVKSLSGDDRPTNHPDHRFLRIQACGFGKFAESLALSPT